MSLCFLNKPGKQTGDLEENLLNINSVKINMW